MPVAKKGLCWDSKNAMSSWWWLASRVEGGPNLCLCFPKRFSFGTLESVKTLTRALTFCQIYLWRLPPKNHNHIPTFSGAPNAQRSQINQQNPPNKKHFPTWTSPKKHPSQKFVHHQVAVQRYFLWLIREVLQPLEGHPSDESQSLVCKSHKDRVVRPLPYIASFKRLKKKEGLENQPQKTTFGPSPGEPNPPVAISFPPICPNQNISPT